MDRSELTGTLITMEFGSGGRIGQLWVADPVTREEGEEFQFVLPPVNLGEEFSEDYNPGTILLGARTNPDDPWILSRNTHAEFQEELDGPSIANFAYEFSLLPEIKATGRFYEIPGSVPQVVWDLKLKNAGKVSLEIGELGFPMALNTLLEGFPKTDRGAESLFKDRVHVHKFIGGAASYVFAQRLTAEPPGLLITPGNGTSWEFCHHVPASLVNPYRWEGIPVVYIHSRATIEREGWSEWFNGHTSRILEPGDLLEAQMRFFSASRDAVDGVFVTMAAARRPTMRIFPGSVAPAEVGIAVEVAGATPTRFFASGNVDMDTDSDVEGGYCHIRPREPGPVTLSFEDTDGRVSHAHVLIIDPIQELINRRAEWIVANQIVDRSGSNLHGAFAPVWLESGLPMTDPEDYAGPFGIESILADALFLAQKNTIYPDRKQIDALESFIDTFLRANIQNPGSGAIGSSFIDLVSTAVNSGRAHLYPIVALLYHRMATVSLDVGTKSHDAAFYMCQSALTVRSLEANAEPSSWRNSGIPLMADLQETIVDLETEMGLSIQLRGRDELARRRFPFAGSSSWDTDGYEEVFDAAMRAGNIGLQDRVMSFAFAARSTAPCWWWYGSDKRWLDDSELLTHPAMSDKGEMCLGPTTASNSGIFLRSLSRDSANLPEPITRMAFGGLLGVWALVRPDGAASCGFCPDPASRQYGMSDLTGNVGLGLYHYLRKTGAYVLPNRQSGVMAFGTFIESKEVEDGVILTVQPWDGVGQRVIVRQIGIELECQRASIREAQLHSRKRQAVVELTNPSDFDRRASLQVKGLWGTQFDVDGKKEHTSDGVLRLERRILALGAVKLEIKVLS